MAGKIGEADETLQVIKIKTYWQVLYAKTMSRNMRRKKVLWHFEIQIRGSLNKFPDIFRMGTFIDSTHIKH